MKQCTCYALRAIDCTCKPAKYGELYTSPTAKQEQGEPLEYWNAVEGWVKLDEVREHFDSVSCGTIYKNGGEGRVPLSLAKPKQEHGELVAWEKILGAVSRGWCHEENANKTMDIELAMAIVKEVKALYTTPQQRKPLTRAEIINAVAVAFNFNSRDYDEIIEPVTRAIEAAHGIKEMNT
jgi:hypothetical protein